MVNNPSSINPLGYSGIDPKQQPKFFQANRAADVTDYTSFQIGDQWLDNSTPIPSLYVLKSVKNNSGVWGLLGSVTNIFPHGVLTGQGTSAVLSSPVEENTTLIGDASNKVKNTTTLNNGQLLIGSTGSAPVVANLTAGAGIVLAEGSGSITITSTGGVNYPIDVFNGGTGVTSLTDGGILLGSGTADVTVTPQPTNGQLLIGVTGSDPTLSVLTAGTNITITNTPGGIKIDSSSGIVFPLSVPQGGTGASTLIGGGILLGNNGFDIVATTQPLNGQLLIGVTGSNPTLANLTAGTGITISNTPGGITINATGSGGLTFPLTIAQGGTGLATIPTGGLLIGNGTSNLTVTSQPINGQILIGFTGSNPILSTLTAGTGINIVNGAGTITISSTGGVSFPILASQGGTGLTTLTSGGVLIGNGTGNVTVTPQLSNGQLLIGNVGSNPVLSTITAGTGISVVNGPGSITINSQITSIPVIVSQGGTGLNTLTSGGILLGNGTSSLTVTPQPTNGQLLIGNTGSNPVLSTITGGTGITVSNTPGAITINATPITTPVPVTDGGTGLESLTDGGILLGSGTGDVTVTPQPSDGQLLVGVSGSDPTLATLTAGTNITITNTPGSIKIDASSGSGIAWSEITTNSFNLLKNNGYITNNISLIIGTLPLTASLGDTFRICGKGSGGWKIAQNPGQIIKYNGLSSASGIGGYIKSTGIDDCIEILCTATNTTFTVISSQGILNII